MKLVLLILMLFIFNRLLAQRHIVLDSNFVKVLVYFDESNIKIKEEYYYDKEGKIHPKVLSYNKNGVLETCYHYYHGRLLKSDSYSVKGENKGQVIKINGVKIDNIHSIFTFHDDSTEIQTSEINYTDEYGFRQGKWHIRDIILDGSGLSYEEYYYTGYYENGKKQGNWRYYNFYGKQLVASVTYKNDTLNGTGIFFNSKGFKTVSYEYINGKQSGEYKTYYENGKVRVLATLKENDFVGEYFEYRKNGKIKRYISDTTKEHPYK